LVPAFNDSIYEELFTNICPLFSSPNFPIMIVPTQVASLYILHSEDCQLACMFVACFIIGVGVNYIHITLVRCRNIFIFILCIILDLSNTVYISFQAGQEAKDDV
jgi:hypothetical protein